MMLKVMGHETRAAYDGLEALEVAAEFTPELVILDLGMPRLNGYDTARRMREEPWGKSIMLVALSGWGQEEDRRKSQAAGFDAHLLKTRRSSFHSAAADRTGNTQRLVRSRRHVAAKPCAGRSDRIRVAVLLLLVPPVDPQGLRRVRR